MSTTDLQELSLEPLHQESPVRRTADILVEVLANAGVELIFGLPGGPISPIHDALLTQGGIRHVTTRHESGAMFAAAGYAHATGRLGVAAVTSGPGVLNAMTGLASAHCDGLPVLLLVGEVPRKVHGRGALQDGSSHGLNIIGMTRHITKMSAELVDPSNAPLVLHRAIATALSGRRGPVVLTLPLDVTNAMVTPARIAAQVGLDFILDPRAIDELAALLALAARPMILAGSGCRGQGAPARLRALAEIYQCPVATTPKAKGVFPEDHPLSLGVFGLGGHPSARSYAERGLDLALIIGSSLGDVATEGWSPLLKAKRQLIQVDIDAQQIGRSYTPTHALVAPAASFCAAMLERRPTHVPRIIGGGVTRHQLGANAVDRLAPQDAISEIQAVLPADTIYTVDSGDHFLFATHFLELSQPDSFVVMTGLGSMGQSIGGAIGVKLARPDRMVAAICGDGCFAMNGFEIATAAAEKIPMVLFVFNDRRLGMVEHGHRAVYGREASYPIVMDVGQLARGLGADFVRVDRPGEILQLTDRIGRLDGPLVVDVIIDPDVRMPSRDRMVAIDSSRAHKLVN